MRKSTRATRVELIQFFQQLPEQPAQMIAVAAFQSQFEFRARVLDAGGRIRRQISGCSLAGNNGVQDGPAALACHVAQH